MHRYLTVTLAEERIVVTATNMSVTNAVRRSAQIVFRKVASALHVWIAIKCPVYRAWRMGIIIFFAMDVRKVVAAIVDC